MGALFSMMASLALLGAQEAAELRGVYLISSADTVFLLPLEGLSRGGPVRAGTLVGAYQRLDESDVLWTETEFEFDCASERITPLRSVKVRIDGSRQIEQTEPSEEVEGFQYWPPIVIMREAVCSDIDLAPFAIADWRAALPELTATLEPY